MEIIEQDRALLSIRSLERTLGKNLMGIGVAVLISLLLSACGPPPPVAPGPASGQRLGESGFTLEEVTTMVFGGFPTNRILDEAADKCIAFPLDEAAVGSLLEAGAEQALIRELREVCATKYYTLQVSGSITGSHRGQAGWFSLQEIPESGRKAMSLGLSGGDSRLTILLDMERVPAAGTYTFDGDTGHSAAFLHAAPGSAAYVGYLVTSGRLEITQSSGESVAGIYEL